MKNFQLIPPSLDLAPKLFRIIKENDAHLRRFLTWLDTVKVAQDSADFLAMCIKQEQEYQAVHRYILYDNQLIGTLGVRDLQSDHPNIGYWLIADSTGQGIMSFALQKLLTELQALKVCQQPLYLSCREDNPASQRVAEKCGFIYQSHLKDQEENAGVSYDLRVYRRACA